MENIANKNLTTSQLDPSMGLQACKAYQEGDYKTAESLLVQILDSEPNNWLARYYLAVCLYKTKQMFTAQRAFRYLYDKCADAEIKSKACLMLQRVNGDLLEGGNKKPLEFGRYCDTPGARTT
jgi:Flp pilus assembly protein TadD